MRQAFWKNFQTSFGTFRHHLSLSLFQIRSRLQPYYLAGIKGTSKESISGPICFHCQMFFSASPQEDHFPWVWSQNQKATSLNTHPSSLLLSAEASWQKWQAAPNAAQVSLATPAGNVTATVSSQEASDSKAKSVLYAFLFFLERKPFQFYAPILINTLFFFLANSFLSNGCFIGSSITCSWDKCFCVFLLQNIIL